LPSGILTAATWDPDLAYAGGRMIGNEARSSGFNVMLAGGINLMRDPRNGRNFEYGGEDPWLAASMVAAQIRGIQSNHILSTIKHYAFNDQETSRNSLSVHIGDASARESDLLAFQLAIEQSKPGAVMCSYNRINGVYSCENDWLLNQVLKTDWGYPGFVMSDWGGAHSTIPAAIAGLDQDSGFPFDVSPYFGDALREAVENGHVPQSRLDDMVMRILRSMFDKGLFDNPVKAVEIDFAAHAQVTQADAEGGMVLLKNARHLLPLDGGVKSIAIIGSHADVGVLSGSGSSQVYSAGGQLVVDSVSAGRRHMIYYRSSPLTALAARNSAHIVYDEGDDIKAAAKLAAKNDIAIVFAHEWRSEGADGTLRLDGEQDALIDAVAKANRKTLVVLENGGPVLMPWIDKVAGVLEAWYPGSSGGEAIARVLTGEVDASGRLPVTYPRSLQQLPRPVLDGYPEKPHARLDVDYTIEGAAVGYKWYDRKGLDPLFAFGFGLGYGRFVASDLTATVDKTSITAHFSVKNTGARAGQYVAELYVSPVHSGPAAWEAPKRLCGFKKVSLQPGAGTQVSLNVDPRLLAVFDEAAHRWRVAAGEYEVILASDARTPLAHARVQIPEETIAMDGTVKN
jgi:beta-glucosidase